MIRSFLQKQLKFYERRDFVFFTLLTLLSVFNGESTVFYLIYFFWWNEIIRLVIDGIFLNRNPNIKIESSTKHLDIPSFFFNGYLFCFYSHFLWIYCQF